MTLLFQQLSTTFGGYFSSFQASLHSSSLADGTTGLWLKLAYTVFVLALIPVYWKYWGPANFLWLPDFALFLGIGALWLESSLLTSILAVGVLFPALYWTFELVVRLLSGKRLSGQTDYLWNQKHPLHLRLLSLFHVFLPAVLLLMLTRLGYDPRAPYFMTLLGWIVLFLCYKLTPPSANINWVFGFGSSPQYKISSRYFVLLMMTLYPILLFFPTHFLLAVIFW
ncbi:hypothetical protein [Nafulsella turpanensis]|uniref:hypothetical protein n=1 Tax=Nafulsella turpanensis TaxID=1265690 RepID=UPI00034D89DB|nr:hypothetical protein [Nafulsella turpanensis]